MKLSLKERIEEMKLPGHNGPNTSKTLVIRNNRRAHEEWTAGRLEDLTQLLAR